MLGLMKCEVKLCLSDMLQKGKQYIRDRLCPGKHYYHNTYIRFCLFVICTGTQELFSPPISHLTLWDTQTHMQVWEWGLGSTHRISYLSHMQDPWISFQHWIHFLRAQRWYDYSGNYRIQISDQSTVTQRIRETKVPEHTAPWFQPGGVYCACVMYCELVHFAIVPMWACFFGGAW